MQFLNINDFNFVCILYICPLTTQVKTEMFKVLEGIHSYIIFNAGVLSTFKTDILLIISL